jgi:beta-mannosidase
MPRTMGTIYWQLNDCWPGPSWSSIDSLGRWKALHYMAKRFYQPLMVSGLENMQTGTVEIHVTSDLPDEKKAIVRWTLTTTDGELIHTSEEPVTAAPYADTLALKLELADQIPSNREVLLWLELSVGTEVVSDNLVLFARPKHLNLRDPHIHATLSDVGEGKVIVQLTAEHPALWVWLSTPDGNLKYSDNFIHLEPGVTKTVEITGAQGANELLERLQIQSLLDTYQQPEVMLR